MIVLNEFNRRMKMMKKSLLTGFVWIMLLLLCISAAFAEDAEQNLAEYGLNPEDILLEKFKFLPEGDGLRFPFGEKTDRPYYLWFDVTGDGCVDLCTERMYGSGMVRIQLSVYDPLSQETYILDGYDYYYLLDSISDGRIIINKNGPYGYGEPVTDTRGTVILNNERLVFVADPVLSGDGDPFDPAQAAVSADEAVRIACGYVRENPDAEYCNEVTVGHIVTEDGESCWQIMFSWIGNQNYTVWVNTETGEVENGFSIDE